MAASSSATVAPLPWNGLAARMRAGQGRQRGCRPAPPGYPCPMSGESLFAALEPLLEQVSKPIQYVGGELNSTVKDWDAAAGPAARS